MENKTPTGSGLPTGSGSSAALPQFIIAQAEAAIAGNASTPNKLSYTQHQDTLGKTSSHGYGGSQSANIDGTQGKHLEIPDIVEPSGTDTSGTVYDDKSGQIEISQDGFDTQAKVTDDGRVNININQKSRRLSDLLVPALRSQLALATDENQQPLPPGYIPPSLGGQPGQVPPPRLNVVIHVVGSRGDVQPFVALGKTLKSTYGHRVRLATHPVFQSFVEESELEFFSIGGDPAELMAFMVKNPGLMPGLDSLKSGDVGKRRKGMEEIVLGCWRSCIEPGDGLGAPPRKDRVGEDRFSFEGGINMNTSPSERPFIADAIIANPPSFAHIHIAEKLGIPLHLMFTMPWSPTQSFPHPLANIQSSNADVNMTNFISYALVEMMTWQGLGDVINRFRERVLGLDPISLIWAPGMLSRLRVPYTYCWSPALIPKPKDWGQHISISGFYFLSLASSYTPAPDLAAFLAEGPPPVYIGFGSIVVDDPNAMTKLIFEAVKMTGVRAIVSKGWGGLGADELGAPEGIFMLGNCPHDWLFKHVSCVVHHGGAGTTAAGIALGRPTVIVPFFGDQPFWGAMVARAGAGPPPIPIKLLTAHNLSSALVEALKPETLEKARELGERIREEKGSETGSKSFHDHLKVDDLRCILIPSRVAVWCVKKTELRLSALAATVLANEGLLDFGDLKLYRPREYETEVGPWDPISGGASALLGTIASLTMGVADFPVEIFKAFKAKPQQKSSETSSAPHSSSKDGPKLTSPVSISRSQSQVDLSSSATSLESSLTDHTLVQISDSSATSNVTSVIDSNATEKSSPGPSSFSGSTSRELQPHSDSSSPIDHKKDFDSSNITLESAIGASKGLSRIVGAGLKSPMDFTLGLARGFHNAPKLYGDDTVRPQEKVTDFQSGLKAAGKEFGYGFYDGISGLITQPLRGAEKDGAAGLIKGIGKGIGGLVLKPGAAIWGLPGYTFMGIHKEIRKLFGASVLNYIISARTAQGYENWKSSTKEERVDIIRQWHKYNIEVRGVRQELLSDSSEGQESGGLSSRGFLQTRHLSFEDRKKLQEDRKVKREQDRVRLYEQRKSKDGGSVLRAPSEIQPEDFEQAIQDSVAATSHGDPDEDLLIERAIRASVKELQRSSSSVASEQDAMDRAIQASITEATKGRSHESSSLPEYDALLEKSIEESFHGEPTAIPGESDRDTDDDDNVRLAVAASIAAHEKDASRAKTEEEIVLQYIKKQSLAEEEHRKAAAKGQKPVLDATVVDEDLNRAIEESMKSI